MELDDSYTNLKISEQMFESLYGPADSRTLTSRSYLAWLESSRGNYDLAIQTYEDLIGLFNTGTPWDTKASILNDYAAILNGLEKYDDAISLLESSLKLWIENDPARSEVPNIHSNLAYAYHGLLDYQQSEENYRKAISLMRDLYPDDYHPDLAVTLNNLGVLYAHQGHQEKAIEYYLQSIEIRQATLGETHPSTAFAQLNLARNLLDLKRIDEARPHAMTALEVMKNKLHESHQHLLIARLTLARINILEGDYELAESELTDVLSLMDKEYISRWVIEETEEMLSDTRLLRDE